jgi:3-deoxy-manno-octulosonate cytidylyltransferase (CMP-KDO synthetase)
MRTIAIIPARYASSRFPGKPLADIHGKPMVWHVYEAARSVAAIDDVCVATDDERIASACENLGISSFMTSTSHATGTDRLAECINRIDADFIVNIQGDEPMIAPETIESVVQAMQACGDPAVMASNGYAVLGDPHDVLSHDVVKVSLTARSAALAFSRYAIPFARGARVTYRKQLGLYCFRREGLELFSSLKPGPVEQSESVEMLRFLEHGYQVLMVEVEDRSVAVDTPFDLHRVRTLMEKGYEFVTASGEPLSSENRALSAL